MKHLSILIIVLGAACYRQSAMQMPPVLVESIKPVVVQGDYVTTAQDPFQPLDNLDRPGPNRYRAADGNPGPDYWQQRADYKISATLDTVARSVTGTVTIWYTNNSPDSLRYLWMQLDQNLYAPNSKGSALFPADSRWGVRGFKGGYRLADVTVDGRSKTPRLNDTMMRLDMHAPIPPKGGRVVIKMSFSFTVPDHGSDRMGRDSSLYEIAQWYPRMAVYDDVRGWNTDPYLGQGEFYLEYGDVDYDITVPAGYTVAGSGLLLNAKELFSEEKFERFRRADTDTGIVQLITESEAVASRNTQVSGTKTWRFRAANVRDVAWAAAPDFRWDATSWNGILCQAFYPVRAGKAWESAAEQTRWSIKTYSELFFPYPYPQATSVAGPVGGMEYPMFVMVHYGDDNPNSIFRTLDHEHGHQWYPMIVGSNERRYAWMDEGINTYVNTFSLERRYASEARLYEVYPRYIQNWRDIKAHDIDSPLMTMPDNINPAALGALGYRKPAALLLTLRNHVVDKGLFDDAFRAYTRAWAFKHPTPGDFFRTVENHTGEDLSWFWRSFFYTTDVLDLGIDSVHNNASGTTTILLQRHTSVPFPVTIRIKYQGGQTEDIHLPVNIWRYGSKFEASISTTGKGQVTGARLWPDPSVPDWNSVNDTWGEVPPEDSPKPVTW